MSVFESHGARLKRDHAADEWRDHCEKMKKFQDALDPTEAELGYKHKTWQVPHAHSTPFGPHL